MRSRSIRISITIVLILGIAIAALGFAPEPYMHQADLVMVINSRAPWYPPNAGPQHATVVVMGETPIKGDMVYQNLMADLYVEGDLTLGLGLLIEALQPQATASQSEIQERKKHWETEHNKLQDGYRAAAVAAQAKPTIDPVWLCAAISEVMPEDTVYAEETTSHRGAILRHVQWQQPHSYLHPAGGLGQGLGLALGAKLAKPDQPSWSLLCSVPQGANLPGHSD